MWNFHSEKTKKKVVEKYWKILMNWKLIQTKGGAQGQVTD